MVSALSRGLHYDLPHGIVSPCRLKISLLSSGCATILLCDVNSD